MPDTVMTIGLIKALAPKPTDEQITTAVDSWLDDHPEVTTDVQVNGVSVVSDGVANVPKAGDSTLGVVKGNSNNGINITTDGSLFMDCADSTTIKNGTNVFKPIVPYFQQNSVFYGLAKAAGDSTQSASDNAVGIYTESAKSAISDMLNAPETVSGTTPSITAKAGVRYICGECSTLAITVPASGIIDVVFTSGETPTALTVTPPAGMTIKWANDFNPTNLNAETIYEINIMDGEYGVVASWT